MNERISSVDQGGHIGASQPSAREPAPCFAASRVSLAAHGSPVVGSIASAVLLPVRKANCFVPPIVAHPMYAG